MLRIVGSTALLLFLVPSLRADEKRYEFLLSRLDAPVSIDVEEAPLKLLLSTLDDLASLPGYEKDPAKKVRIRVGEIQFKSERQGEFDIERLAPIKLPGKLSEVPLSTVLTLICEQLDGVFVVGKEFIDIVPATPFRRDLGLPSDDEHVSRSLMPLVHCNYKKMPLAQALEALAEKSGRSIVLSQQVPDETAKKEVTMKLANTPFETAIEFLAATVDLKVVTRGDTYLVTTRKQADEFLEQQRKRAPAKTPESAPNPMPPSAAK